MYKVGIITTRDKGDEPRPSIEDNDFVLLYASPLELVEKDTDLFDAFIDEISSGKPCSIVLTSPNSVKFMFSLLEKRGKASQVFTMMNRKGVLSIGPATNEVAKARWLKTEQLPERFSADQLADQMRSKLKAGDPTYIIGSEKGSEVITQGIELAGGVPRELPVFKLKKTEPDRSLLDMYFYTVNGGMDVLGFTSPSNAKAFIEEGERKYGVRQFGTALNATVVAAMNAQTKDILESMGIEVDILARNATIDDMLSAIRTYVAKTKV